MCEAYARSIAGSLRNESDFPGSLGEALGKDGSSTFSHPTHIPCCADLEGCGPAADDARDGWGGRTSELEEGRCSDVLTCTWGEAASQPRSSTALPTGGAHLVCGEQALKDSKRTSHPEIDADGPDDIEEWVRCSLEATALPADTKKKMTELCVTLDRIVKAECGRDARVELFGSSVCGFATIHSDLDLTVTLLGQTLSLNAKKDLLKRLSKCFRFKQRMNSFAVLNARVPVIKLKDPVSGLAADVTIQNDMPVFKSDLLLQYSKIDPRFKQLVLLIKTWSTSRNINNASHGTLNSFGYTFLVLYYLQRVSPPVLPYLHEERIHLRGAALTKARHESKDEWVCLPAHSQGTVAGVKIHYALGDRLKGWGSENDNKIGELLAGFFRFYATECDLKGKILCVRDPNCPQRERLQPPLNQEMIFWMRDPLDPRDNIARGVNAAAAERMTNEFVRAHELLSAGRVSVLCEKVSPGGARKKPARTRPAVPGSVPENVQGHGPAGGDVVGAAALPNDDDHASSPAVLECTDTGGQSHESTCE